MCLAAESFLPWIGFRGPNCNGPSRAAPPDHLHEMIGLGFGEAINVKAGLAGITITL